MTYTEGIPMSRKVNSYPFQQFKATKTRALILTPALTAALDLSQ